MTFFDQQNAKIKSGELAGEVITVSALMINKYVLRGLMCNFYHAYIR